MAQTFVKKTNAGSADNRSNPKNRQKPIQVTSLMSKTLSTIFVTDVPFWEQRTGAHLRIAQLIHELNNSPFSSQTLLTQLLPDTDLEAIQQNCPIPLKLVDLSSPPRSGVAAKTKWYVRALANQVGIGSNSDHQPTFHRYYPQAIVDRFLLDVKSEKPDILVFEYVNQIQLLRALPKEIREKTLCVVDTHDVLWQRAKQFRDNNQKHWIDVYQEDEEKALNEFDLVIAIQDEEAEYFSSVVDSTKVITTGMEFEVHTSPQVNQANERIAVGLMASNNWANVDTVQQILSTWQKISELNLQLELLLAGSVCESEIVKSLSETLDRVRLLGKVNSPAEFYDKVDAVWNPVRFGTGLKIKNLEGLSFAKCLITSPHGAVGMKNILGENGVSNGNSSSKPFVILNDTESTLAFFSGLNQDIIQSYSQSGQNHLKSHFGVGTQYPQLRRKLESLYSSKTSKSQ